MSEKAIETLIDLLKEYKVEIPIVQRDYAQGRQDDHTNMVRYNLLKDVKSAILRKTQPLDLNFVYGKVEGDKFIPLDGQQRLTTLFLLHLYAFNNDDSKTELLTKFTYETRKSSRTFFEKLIKNRKEVFTSVLSPSKEIEDSAWFVSMWKYDPTIQSVLVMLDAIKETFCDVENLAEKLISSDYVPITFKFLKMNDLGMEDSLYIKLNARGKPLTSFENLKAQLIGRQRKLNLPFVDEVELNFDGIWTDLFWSNSRENFDVAYLTFFGVLFMNKGMISSDSNWANPFDFEKVDAEIFETIYYTLNFLCNNKDSMAYQLIFNALSDSRTYSDRVLFHAVTTYLHKAKGIDNGFLTQWLRIIKNLTVNTRIDDLEPYRRAIEGINKLADNWNDLLSYFSGDVMVTGFSQEQIVEEQIKARIILQNKSYAEIIYKAEEHPYFNGQIRSALYYAGFYESNGDIEVFKDYWNKISALFNKTEPKHGNLLRRALLTFGDYTLTVGAYKTLCVDRPDEPARTPGMKRLFSNHGVIVKKLLDSLNLNEDISEQLNRIISNSNIQKTDWRYCLIAFPELFIWMSTSHLRLREVGDEMIIIPNKSSSGYNYEIFIAALNIVLKKYGIGSTFEGFLGTWAERYLRVGEWHVRFEKNYFIVSDLDEKVVFKTSSEDPITEVTDYIRQHISKKRI